MSGTSRIEARYWIETAWPLQRAAEMMAGEQSTGTFVRVPGETDEMREHYAARVENVRALDEVSTASLPGSGLPKTWDGKRRAAEVTLSWPLHNMGPSLPNILSTVAGNLSELKPFSGLKLIDVKFPPELLKAYQGPQFGVAGTRALTGVEKRPLIGTIIKPSVGMDPDATAERARILAEAGVDFIKDDELQADGPACPFEQRVPKVLRALNDIAQRTGRKVMYAANITGDIDEMLRRHDLVVREGGTCVMVCVNSIGLPALKALRAHSQVAIHGHRTGWGMLSRSPAIGASFVAWQKFWRLAGIDHTHVNGIDNKFCEENQSVIASAQSCLTPMFDAPAKGCEVMPVFSSGQSAKQAAATYQALNSTDLIFACGGGIIAHPGGMAAGVQSLRDAWQAAVEGIPLETYAKSHEALRHSLESFAQ